VIKILLGLENKEASQLRESWDSLPQCLGVCGEEQGLVKQWGALAVNVFVVGSPHLPG
jgi:hypothetical protein